MDKQYYECHITMDGDPKLIREIVEAMGWSFSAIDGDIVMGEGTKCYATRHFNARKSADIVVKVVQNVAEYLREEGFTTTREKVELVFYDSRSASVRPSENTHDPTPSDTQSAP